MTCGFSMIENYRLENEMRNLAAARNFIHQQREIKYGLIQLLLKYYAPYETVHKMRQKVKQDCQRSQIMLNKWTLLWAERYLQPNCPQHPDQRTIDKAEEMAYEQMNSNIYQSSMGIFKNILLRLNLVRAK